MATAAILGCAGYSGQETLDRLLAHPELEPIALGSDSLAGGTFAFLDKHLRVVHVPAQELLQSNIRLCGLRREPH